MLFMYVLMFLCVDEVGCGLEKTIPNVIGELTELVELVLGKLFVVFHRICYQLTKSHNNF